MNCSEARKLTALYSGGDLDSEEAVALEEHIRSCQSCRQLLDSCKSDRELISSLHEMGPLPPRKEEFWLGLEKKLKPDMDRRRIRTFMHRAVRGITAAAILLIVATFLVNFDKQQISEPPIQMEKEADALREEVKLENKFEGLELEECELCIDSCREYDF